LPSNFSRSMATVEDRSALGRTRKPLLRALRDASNRTLAKIKTAAIVPAIASPESADPRRNSPVCVAYFDGRQRGAASVPRLVNPRSPNAYERVQSRCRRRLGLLPITRLPPRRSFLANATDTDDPPRVTRSEDFDRWQQLSQVVAHLATVTGEKRDERRSLDRGGSQQLFAGKRTGDPFEAATSGAVRR
jgi:hypothetical protein